ncbi:MAG: T9SS type A sorting domain-containing protein [Flavobacteriales bacterium]|nr:MAG: T9SS type A sorting domain-containing protein [Flavobacteriales bacterium]
MRTQLLALSAAATTTLMAQSDFVEYYTDDMLNPTMVYRYNAGQIMDTNGDPVTEAKAKSEGLEFTVWPCIESSLAYSWGSKSNPALAFPDLLHKITMTPWGETAQYVDPTFDAVQPGVHNYYTAGTGTGITGVQSYGTVTYRDYFPDIDLLLYSGGGGPKMAIICHPGSDPDNVVLHFEGQDSLHVDDITGTLKAYSGLKWIELREALAYQWNANDSIINLNWTGEWTEDNTGDNVHLQWDTYDPALPLVFLIGAPPPPPPPTANGNLDWCTLVGDGAVGEPVVASTTRPNGDLLVTTIVNDPGYPPTNGSSQYPGAAWDVSVGRYLYAPGNATDDAVNNWVTLIGGADWDLPYAIAYDATTDQVLMAGGSKSTDYVLVPQFDPNDGTYWQGVNKGGYDGMLSWFNSQTGTLLRSTYFGGEGDDMFNGAAFDGLGNLFFCGTTNTATGGTNGNCTATAAGFPVCDGGGYFAGSLFGQRDAFVGHIDPNNRLKWSSYFGTSNLDEALCIAVHEQTGVPGAEHIVIGGRNSSSLTTLGPPGSFQDTGNSNGFIASFEDDYEKHWITNLKTMEGIPDLDLDRDRLIVTGSVTQVSVGCAPGVGAPLCDPGNGAYFRSTPENVDQYLAEFDLPSGVLEWSTLVGGQTRDHVPLFNFSGAPEMGLYPFPVAMGHNAIFDGNGNLFTTGIVQHHTATPLAYVAQQAATWYHQPYFSNSGWQQTDAVINAFLSDRTKEWTTMLGIFYPHTDTLTDIFIFGGYSDIPMGIAVSDGHAFYVTGQSGALDDWPVACPYPGTSYCEAIGSSSADGFVARFQLDGSALAVEAAASTSEFGLFPNPTAELLHVRGPVRPNDRLEVFDAMGRLVGQATSALQPIGVERLADGTYAVRLLRADEPPLFIGRFIKQ